MKENVSKTHEAVRIAARFYDFTPEMAEKLSVFIDILESENKKYNLTALESSEDIALLHILDSLSLLEVYDFSCGIKVFDLGSGAGFPAIPIAVCTRANVFANDATAKKTAFIDMVSSRANIANLSSVPGRAEELGHEPAHREAYNAVMARGVARLNILCELCMPLIKPGGSLLAMKGSRGEEELAEAENAIKLLGGRVKKVHKTTLPSLEHERTIIVIDKIKSTNEIYPRSYARIKKKPL